MKRNDIISKTFLSSSSSAGADTTNAAVFFGKEIQPKTGWTSGPAPRHGVPSSPRRAICPFVSLTTGEQQQQQYYERNSTLGVHLPANEEEADGV
uniref:Uncharacterized protein n=1 Tax=Plectus sambesii TaxID=2011161 RepID=A0A914WL04_9BILA